MRYWLEVDFLLYLINAEILNTKQPYNGNFSLGIEHSKNWCAELVLITYFLGIALLSLKKNHPLKSVIDILEELLALDNSMLINYNQLDTEFITYIMRVQTDNQTTLIEEITSLHEDFLNYDYANGIRS